MIYRRLFAATGAMLLVLVAVWIIWQAGLPEHPPPLEKVPSFEAQTLNGSSLVIHENINRPLIITFWATWCVPCMEEMPLLERTYQQNKDTHDLLVVGINAGFEEPQQVEQWLLANHIAFPIVMDQGRKLERLYGVRGLPTTFFVDHKGTIIDKIEGAFREDRFNNNLTKLGLLRGK